MITAKTKRLRSPILSKHEIDSDGESDSDTDTSTPAMQFIIHHS